MDPMLCASLSQAQTAAMALTALSACVDALLARELGSAAGAAAPEDEDVLLRLGSRGIGAVAEGLPVALADGNNSLARELLAIGGVCAGQLSAITPAPPAQVRWCLFWSTQNPTLIHLLPNAVCSGMVAMSRVWRSDGSGELCSRECVISGRSVVLR